MEKVGEYVLTQRSVLRVLPQHSHVVQDHSTLAIENLLLQLHLIMSHC